MLLDLAGVEVAEQIPPQIDRDRDGAISNDEAAAYAEMLKQTSPCGWTGVTVS